VPTLPENAQGFSEVAPSQPIGERRHVTALFADMAGFTAASERLGEESAYDLMQAVFAVMATAVREQGGNVGNFTGDGVMAIFGAPLALEDAPLRACKASVLIHERLAAAAPEIERQHGVRPILRIGLNAGLATRGLQSSEHLGLLLNLLGLKAPEDALAGLDGTLIGLRTRDLLQTLLEARGRLSPIVLQIEDLHWIDSASEEVLNTLIRRTDLPGFLIVHTRRPEYQSAWIGSACVTTLKLEPLDAEDVIDIVRGRLDLRILLDTLASLAVERADGNPLFAEEIASFVTEHGGVGVSGGREFDMSLVALGIPASLQSLLAARLDNLSAPTVRCYRRRRLLAATSIGACWMRLPSRRPTSVPN
jgi:Adenylate and Guanylate cyclase catalytic domain